MTRVAELWLACSVEPWCRLGFTVVETSRGKIIRVADLDLRFVEADTAHPVSGWSLEHPDHHGGECTEVDGIDTEFIAPSFEQSSPAHELKVVGIDHIVITTGSLDRTCGAIENQLQLPLKRVRDAGNGVRQGFHRAGPIILEIVERPDLPAGTPAALWGLVLNVADLDTAVARIGPDNIGAPKDAVQKGRRIATFRRDAGLVIPVALMSPDGD